MNTNRYLDKITHINLHEYNTTKTTFKDGTEKYFKTSFSNFKGKSQIYKHDGSMSSEQLEEKTRKYLKKVKNNIINLAFNFNKWEYFITLTFDFREIGDYSHDKAINLLTKFINNQKHQNKNFTYLLVPEFHKSGRLHFHGLVANVPNWKLKEARSPKTNRLIKVNGLQIYNLENYKIGYTTISKIQSQEKVSSYISKYATKELITLKNKKRYWYSRNLEKPKIDYLFLHDDLLDYLVDSNNICYSKIIKKQNCKLEIVKTQIN